MSPLCHLLSRGSRPEVVYLGGDYAESPQVSIADIILIGNQTIFKSSVRFITSRLLEFGTWILELETWILELGT